jgi:transposase-like protein
MAVESCPRCHSRAVNRSGAKRWCASCGRDLPDDDVTTAERAAYERGRAEGYAACMAHVAETAEKIAHAAGGGYDTNIAVATLRRFVGALEASRVGAAQKKGGAT